MTIKYKLLEISDNMSQSGKKRKGYYPRIVRKNTITTDGLAKSVGRGSVFKAAEAKGIIEQLLLVIESELLNGNHVTLDGFGTFALTAQAKRPIDDPEKVRAESIEVKRVAFKASEPLKRKLKNAHFEKE